MNKKFLFGMFAAASLLFATSCSDELDSGNAGNMATVSFKIGVEDGVQSRAISDGTTADELVYAVYNVTDPTKPLPVFDGASQKTEPVSNLVANEKEVTITLAKGQTYKVAFWAQNSKCTAYNTDALHAVEIDYSGLNNDETRDAFFRTEELTVTGNETKRIILKRPFAQLNVGVYKKDYADAVASGVTITESLANIKNAATKINLLTGETSEPQEVTYQMNLIPNDPEELSVNLDDDPAITEDEKFRWLSMSYVLVHVENSLTGTEKATADLSFTFSPENGNDIVLESGLNTVPLQRNWRTNILGTFLTGELKFIIKIDPAYINDHNIVDGNESTNEIAPGVTYDKTSKTFAVSTAEGLTWVSEIVNGTKTHEFVAPKTDVGVFEGQKVVLSQDINMEGVKFTPIGTTATSMFGGTFDGENNTIQNLTIAGNPNQEFVGLFGAVNGDIKNVKLTNVNVSGYYMTGAVAGKAMSNNIENCHVDGVKITSTPYQGNKGNHVGGIVGHSTSEGASASVKNCSAKNLTITAYRDVAGLIGTASGTVVSGNEVDNITVIADMTVDYNDSGKDANAGAIVGRNISAQISEDNKENNVTVSVLKAEGNIIKIGSAAELFAVAKRVNDLEGFAGKTIELTANIDLGGQPWTPMGNVNNYPSQAFDGVFDGKGFTISNLNAVDNTPVNASAGLFGSITTTAVVKNLTLKNVTVASSHYAGAFVGYISSSGGGTIENCHVDGGTITSTPEWLGTEYDNGDKAGGIIGYIAAGTVTECSVQNLTVTAYRDLAAIAGYADGSAVITNNKIIGNNVNVVISYESDQNYKGYVSDDAHDANHYVGESTNATVENNTGEANISSLFYVTDGVVIRNGAYEISNADGLFWFAGQVNEKSQEFKGKTINLTQNINLANLNGGWTPINAWDGILNGTTIDGCGHTIEYMKVETRMGEAYQQYGFIDNNASSLTIKNLTFDKAVVQVKQDGPKYESSYAGVVIGKNYSPVTLENVHVTNSVVINNWQCGGLVGFAETHAPVFTNCSISDSFVGGSNATAGAIFGLGIVDVTATGCKATNVKLYTDGLTWDSTQKAVGNYCVGHIYGKTLKADDYVETDVTVVGEYPEGY